jgi:hypothetical protein
MHALSLIDYFSLFHYCLWLGMATLLYTLITDLVSYTLWMNRDCVV